MSQPAIEAGVPRWHLTRQHIDLKEMFQANVRNQGRTPAPFQRTANVLQELQQKHLALQAHSSELEERIRLYANVIQVLSTERATAAQPRRVIALTPRQSGRRKMRMVHG